MNDFLGEYRTCRNLVILKLTVSWPRYHIPYSLEALALDVLVAVESQPEIPRLRRDLGGKIRSAEVTDGVGEAMLAITYLEEIETAAWTVLEFELVPKVELQQHTFVS